MARLPGCDTLSALILANLASNNTSPALASSSLRSLRPLYRAVMISASVIQNRALGEMSHVPSAPIGVCSPPVPRTDRPSGLQISLAFLSVPSDVRFGIGMCTLARMPVPRLVGHDVTLP